MNQTDNELARMVRAFLFISCALSGFAMLGFAAWNYTPDQPLMFFMFLANGLLVMFFGLYETLNAFFNKKSILLVDEAEN